ncbi:plasmid mobilization protein [Butyrivibrio sp. AE3004]|uniref:plasmid mobilization protein n=1 Tax=Butyrivibrio sp. AE3004 TaxID=1506994 RepID=UPI00049487DD|nr:plasmid mobilization relaxosome protein MobC [Butyrivibrio sp. AE3004]
MEKNTEIHLRISDHDKDMIKAKMDSAGVKNLSAYIKKMAIDGYIIVLDLSDIKEVVRLMRINSNNLNQYAKKANENGSIYQHDIQQLKEQQEEIWIAVKGVLARLAAIQ